MPSRPFECIIGRRKRTLYRCTIGKDGKGHGGCGTYHKTAKEAYACARQFAKRTNERDGL